MTIADVCNRIGAHLEREPHSCQPWYRCPLVEWLVYIGPWWILPLIGLEYLAERAHIDFPLDWDQPSSWLTAYGDRDFSTLARRWFARKHAARLLMWLDTLEDKP